ncbi:MAG: hypothetical protein IPK74_04215 [Deltaproteobacteria bacterium]|nr:hypothetical protein [Deltaproteobacteria bacterium]
MPPRSALALLAIFAVATPASARVSPSVGAAGQRPTPTAADAHPTAGKTPQPQLKPAKYRLAIQFVRTADDDGGRPSTLTRAKAQAAIDAANVIYRRNGGDVSFVMHADSNFDAPPVRSTALNRDCIFAPGQTIATIEANTDRSVDPQTLCDSTTPANARSAYGLERSDRIVVFSRGGNFKLAWDGDAGHWSVSRPTGGESWGTRSFVRMPSTFDGSSLLAHELGHYLHNPHTFDGGPSVTTAAEAKAAMEAWVADHPGDHPSAVFDGDARSDYPVDDTPPDPRGSLLIDVHGGDKCDPDHGSVTIGVVVRGARQNVTLTPDRSNVMSYFKGCPFPQHFSSAQYENIHAALAGNRRDLLASDGGCYSRGSDGPVVTSDDGLVATIRRIAACKLLERKPMPWEEVMGTIYSQPGDLKAGFRKVGIATGAIGVHVAREKALLEALRTPPVDD